MIRATRTPAPTPSPVRPCVRCGIPREARPDAVLCRSCRSVLTPAERAAWAA